MVKKPDDLFFCCDWGTTSFRLYLASAGGNVLEVHEGTRGAKVVYEYWQAAGSNPLTRGAFYREVLAETKQAFTTYPPSVLQPLPVLVAGMASSSVGMAELPYASLPFTAADYQWQEFGAHEKIPFAVYLFSGVRTATDAMRGEETQCLGMYHSGVFSVPAGEPVLCLLPGTHSKHVWIKGGVITGFKSFFTGEMFYLLKEHSLLKFSVDGNSADGTGDEEAFLEGVQAATENDFLHQLFRVRTHTLFGIKNKAENHAFLSGLVIGTELKGAPVGEASQVLLYGSPPLVRRYRQALAFLFPGQPVNCPTQQQLETAFVCGLLQAFQKKMNDGTKVFVGTV